MILRSKKIFRIANQFVDNLRFKQEVMAIYDLFKLLVIILFIGHLCGCGFLLLSQIEMNYYAHSFEDTWLLKANLTKDSTWAQQYIAGLYYSIITMLTVRARMLPSLPLPRLLVSPIACLSRASRVTNRSR